MYWSTAGSLLPKSNRFKKESVFMRKTTIIPFVRVAALAGLMGAAIAQANVAVTNLFSNHMVLQRAVTVPVWGTGGSGEQVTVTFNGQTKTATTDASGKWMVKLDPMVAGGPFVLTIKGTNTVTITDVYMGEVWQCAGQSNMDTRVSFYPNYASVQNSANIPLLRYYTLRQPGQTPVWETCTTPSAVGALSCLGFFFGREIQRYLDTVAVGLVVTAVGGTTIASWLDPATLAANPTIKTTDATAGGMYTQWIAPVLGCAMRGTVWIQGEQDRTGGLAQYYTARFQMLINAWRKLWGIGDFPFYYVQLANYSKVQTAPNEPGSTPQIRESQRLALSLPNTAMACAIDIGSDTALHFPDKLDAGLRLALPAKALCYGQKDLVYSGPMFESKTIVGNKINLKFRFTGSGLTGKAGAALKGFAIAGSDNNFVWADAAVINGDTVTVSSASVSAPTQVHYDYAGNPTGNFYNKDGLPASPFITEGPQITFPLTGVLSMPQTHADFAVVRNSASQGFYVNAQGCKMTAPTMAGTHILWYSCGPHEKGLLTLKGNIFVNESKAR
jgi:sialate O-acetylesterase